MQQGVTYTRLAAQGLDGSHPEAGMGLDQSWRHDSPVGSHLAFSSRRYLPRDDRAWASLNHRSKHQPNAACERTCVGLPCRL